MKTKYVTDMDIDVIVEENGQVSFVPKELGYPSIHFDLTDLMILLVNNPIAKKIAGDHES